MATICLIGWCTAASSSCSSPLPSSISPSGRIVWRRNSMLLHCYSLSLWKWTHLFGLIKSPAREKERRVQHAQVLSTSRVTQQFVTIPWSMDMLIDSAQVLFILIDKHGNRLWWWCGFVWRWWFIGSDKWGDYGHAWVRGLLLVQDAIRWRAAHTPEYSGPWIMVIGNEMDVNWLNENNSGV